MSKKVLAVILGGGAGTRLISAYCQPFQTGRSHCRQIPAGRYSDFQLPEFRHQPDVCAHAIQFGIAEPAYQKHLSFQCLQFGIC